LNLKDYPVMSSRQSEQPQRRPDSQTSNAGDKVRTAGGSWQTADAANGQCWRSICIAFHQFTVELYAADTGGQLHRARTALADVYPPSAAPRAEDETGHGRTCVCR